MNDLEQLLRVGMILGGGEEGGGVTAPPVDARLLGGLALRAIGEPVVGAAPELELGVSSSARRRLGSAS